MVQISFPVTRIRSLKQGGQTKKGIIIHLIVSMTNTPTSRFHQSPLKEGKRSSRLNVNKLIVENVADRNEIFLRRKTNEFPCAPSSTTSFHLTSCSRHLKPAPHFPVPSVRFLTGIHMPETPLKQR